MEIQVNQNSLVHFESLWRIECNVIFIINRNLNTTELYPESQLSDNLNK